MRLRPSGKAGPAASEVGSFIRYHRESAWTWEHLALTRARVIHAPPALAQRIGDAIRQVLAQPRNTARLAADVADMRRRIDTEHHVDNPWRTKHVRGGLVDLEFIAEHLQLLHAAAHPDVLSPNTLEAFARLGAAGCLAPEDAGMLAEATRLMQRIRGLLRLTVGGDQVEEQASESLRAALARSGDVENFDALRDKLVATQEKVRALFVKLIEEPAGALPREQE